MSDRLHRTAQVAAVVEPWVRSALTLTRAAITICPFMILMSGWVLARSWVHAGQQVLGKLGGIDSSRARRRHCPCRGGVTGDLCAGCPQAAGGEGRGRVFAVPISAWLLMLIGVPLTALISRRRSRSVQIP